MIIAMIKVLLLNIQPILIFYQKRGKLVKSSSFKLVGTIGSLRLREWALRVRHCVW